MLGVGIHSEKPSTEALGTAVRGGQFKRNQSLSILYSKPSRISSKWIFTNVLKVDRSAVRNRHLHRGESNEYSATDSVCIIYEDQDGWPRIYGNAYAYDSSKQLHESTSKALFPISLYARFTGLRRLQSRTQARDWSGVTDGGYVRILHLDLRCRGCWSSIYRSSLQGVCWNSASQPYDAWHVYK